MEFIIQSVTSGSMQKIHEISIEFHPEFAATKLPVLLYKGSLNLPYLFPASYLEKLFTTNGWGNTWDGRISVNPIYGYHHEVIGVYSGATTVLLGGRHGRFLMLNKGDILIIPAGIDRKVIDKPDAAKCVGGFHPLVSDFVLLKDPLWGNGQGIRNYWRINDLPVQTFSEGIPLCI